MTTQARPQARAALDIRPLTPQLGAEVRDLDLRGAVAAETRRALNEAFVRHSVLVIRDQDLDPAAFQRVVALFGEPMEQQLKKFTLPDFPLVGIISSEDRDDANGKPLNRGAIWHTDHSNYPVPPKATILHARSLPTSGGDTQYANMMAAYDDLPEATKRRLDGLKSMHVYNSRFSERRFAKLSEAERLAMPETAQPIVRTHPENGRKALYLNVGRMEGIVGMDDEPAMALIRELQAHATQPIYEYRHKWLPGDVVIWDNRAVQHKANPDFEPGQLRYLYRSMLVGEAPR